MSVLWGSMHAGQWLYMHIIHKSINHHMYIHLLFLLLFFCRLLFYMFIYIYVYVLTWALKGFPMSLLSGQFSLPAPGFAHVLTLGAVCMYYVLRGEGDSASR